MYQKIKKIYKCPKCKSKQFREEISGGLIEKVTRVWNNGVVVEENIDYRKYSSKSSGRSYNNFFSTTDRKIICKKCNEKYFYYKDLFTELADSYKEKELIDWLKCFFSKNYFKESEEALPFEITDNRSIDDNGCFLSFIYGCTIEENEKIEEIFLNINIKNIGNYAERWLLNSENKINNFTQDFPKKEQRVDLKNKFDENYFIREPRIDKNKKKEIYIVIKKNKKEFFWDFVCTKIDSEGEHFFSPKVEAEGLIFYQNEKFNFDSLKIKHYNTSIDY
jgi:hypothetical protein